MLFNAYHRFAHFYFSVVSVLTRFLFQSLCLQLKLILVFLREITVMFLRFLCEMLTIMFVILVLGSTELTKRLPQRIY